MSTFINRCNAIFTSILLSKRVHLFFHFFLNPLGHFGDGCHGGVERVHHLLLHVQLRPLFKSKSESVVEKLAILKVVNLLGDEVDMVGADRLNIRPRPLLLRILDASLDPGERKSFPLFDAFFWRRVEEEENGDEQGDVENESTHELFGKTRKNKCVTERKGVVVGEYKRVQLPT